jgi:hypothetical protein
VSVADDGALLAEASTEQVGDVALSAGVALRELGSTRDGGLERLFFELTQAAATDLPPSTDHGASISPMEAHSTLQETAR